MKLTNHIYNAKITSFEKTILKQYFPFKFTF